MGRRKQKKRKPRNTGILNSLYDKPKPKKRQTAWVKTPQDLKLLEQALEFTGTSTETGKLVFKDVVSGALFIYAPRLTPISPNTKRVKCLPPEVLDA